MSNDTTNDGGASTTKDEDDVDEDKTGATTTSSTSNESKDEQRNAETPEARKARLDRQTEQHKKKHPELYESKTTETAATTRQTTDDFDRSDKAYLIANGIKGDKEMTLAKEFMTNTGKSLEEVLDSKFFQAELKEMRDLETTQAATPGNTRRSGNSGQDTVDYWINRGEMPPKSMPQLRRDYVNAKLKKEKKGGKFYDDQK
jgi:hypothetical protein